MHRSTSTGLRGLAIASALLFPSAAYAQQTQVIVSGVGYLQYVYQLKDTANHVNNFDVTRAYVNLIGKFAGGVGARVTLDVNRPTGDNSLRYRLKYAFATYTPTGSALTRKNPITNAETNSGNREEAKVSPIRPGMASSGWLPFVKFASR